MNFNNNKEVVPTPTPSPTPTPTPSPTPPPAPTPIIEPQPSTTQSRFFSRNNSDGSKTIYDRDNNLDITYTLENGYVARNKEGREVYHIYPDGKASYTLKNGAVLSTSEKMTIENAFANEFTCDNGDVCKISNGNLTYRKRLTEYGYYEENFYNIDGSFYKRYPSDGETIYFDKNGKEYKHIYSWGATSYTTEDYKTLVVCDDGSCVFFGDETVYGTYSIDKDGIITFVDDNHNITKFSDRGNMLSYVNNDGTSGYTNYEKNSLTMIRNGKKRYSMIHHIKYDEVAYDEILNCFVNIKKVYPETINNSITLIQNQIDLLPDKYESDNIIKIGDNILAHVEYIDSIKSMTNYSLLAYQTCDDNLKDSLGYLVDSLFQDNESSLGENFKKAISRNVHDEDNDTILEYKEDTDFNLLKSNVIPTKTFVDINGNIWYFNERNLLVGTKGDNLKLNFAGEECSISYDDNGLMIIKDSSDNPLNIFGDYNLDSLQYGSNQMVFGDERGLSLLDDPEIQKLFNKYYPGATDEEKMAYFQVIENVGCVYASLTNLVFKKFEGDEKGFYDAFGYPMYNVSLNNNNLSIDYNYEPIILDLFSYTNKSSNIEKAIKNGSGANSIAKNNLEKYLKNEYGVDLNSVPGDYTYLADFYYDLYEMDGTLLYENGGGHAMIITGRTDDGREIVSSWGSKYILKKASNPLNWLNRLINEKDY